MGLPAPSDAPLHLLLLFPRLFLSIFSKHFVPQIRYFPSLYLLRQWLTLFRFRYPHGRNLAGNVDLFPVSSEPTPVVIPATAPLSSTLADKAQHSATSPPSIKQAQLEPGTDHIDSEFRLLFFNPNL
jgi:hypothetical protein